MEAVPGPVVNPDLRDADLEVTAAQVEVKVEVTGVKLQSKEVSGLEDLTVRYQDTNTATDELSSQEGFLQCIYSEKT